jgi:hypothetical protein
LSRSGKIGTRLSAAHEKKLRTPNAEHRTDEELGRFR